MSLQGGSRRWRTSPPTASILVPSSRSHASIPEMESSIRVSTAPKTFRRRPPTVSGDPRTRARVAQRRRRQAGEGGEKETETLTPQDLLLRVVDSFDECGVPFVLVGGLALSTWVEPRATRDIDVVVRVRKVSLPRLREALIRAGARPTRLEMRKIGERRFVRFPIEGVFLDVRLGASAHDRSAWKRSSEVWLEGRGIRVASPEDLLLYKLAAWRPQDQVDALSLLNIPSGVDERYVDRWAATVSEETGEPIRRRLERLRRS